MRNFVFGLLITLCAVFCHTTAGAETIYVPGPEASIQKALDGAAPGDTVVVKEGAWTENIVIRKSVTLQSELGPEKTTVAAAVANRPVIMIDGTPDVTLSGFTVTGSTTTGIMVLKSRGAVLTNNNAEQNSYGITLYESNSCTLKDNNASHNGDYGVFLQRSHDNLLENNTASSNKDKGFFISYSDRNRIINNNANLNVWNGITIWASHDNIVKDNLTLRNAFGIIQEDSTGNEIKDNTTLPNIFLILPIFLIYIGILTYFVQKLTLRLIYRS